MSVFKCSECLFGEQRIKFALSASCWNKTSKHFYKNERSIAYACEIACGEHWALILRYTQHTRHQRAFVYLVLCTQTQNNSTPSRRRHALKRSRATRIFIQLLAGVYHWHSIKQTNNNDHIKGVQEQFKLRCVQQCDTTPTRFKSHSMSSAMVLLMSVSHNLNIAKGGRGNARAQAACSAACERTFAQVE